jgi:uncharacterized protein
VDQLAYPPRITSFTRPYFEALARGILLTTRCVDCAELTFPPKVVCPYCWSREITWAELAGTGYLRSFTEVHAAPTMFVADVPYVLGLVDLDEGLRCMARIDGDFDHLSCDQRVGLTTHPAQPAPLLSFGPVESTYERSGTR